MKYDEIHYWSEIKLDIVRDYAAAYSRILNAQKNPALYHIYIDAFAGAGMHISKRTGEFIKGSPLNALLINPPFREYHLIDLDSKKVGSLFAITKEYKNVRIYEGDCNQVLIEKVFPQVKFEAYRRGLCLLDPLWPASELGGYFQSWGDEKSGNIFKFPCCGYEQKRALEASG